MVVHSKCEYRRTGTLRPLAWCLLPFLLAACDSNPARVDPGSSFSSGCIDFDDYARWVGNVPVGFNVTDLAVSEGVLYCTSYGFYVWDVSNRDDPRPLGSLDFSGEKVVARDGYAYVTDVSGLLRVVDVSNPNYPRVTGSVPLPGRALDLVLHWPHLFVIDQDVGLTVVRVSEATSPEIAGILEIPGHVNSLDVKFPHVFLSHTLYGLLVVDVSRPREPRVVAHSGRSPEGGISIWDSFAYVWTRGWLQVVDISEPRSPTLIAETEARPVGCFFSYPNVEQILARDGLVYLLDCKTGIRILDVHRPEDPRSLGSACVPGKVDFLSSLDIEAGTVFVPAERAIAMIDVSRPVTPRPSRDISMADDGVPAMDVTDGLVVLARDERGVEIRDLANPLSPTTVMALDYGGRIVDVSVSDDLACLIDYPNGFALLEIADPPGDSRIRGKVDTPMKVFRAALGVDYAYLAAGDAGLVVADVSDRDAPSVDTTLTFSDPVHRLDVDAGHLYLSGEGMRLTVLDLADPARPSVVAELDSLRWVDDLDAANGLLYVHDEVAGFRVLDVTAPSSPRVLGRLSPFGYSQNRLVADHGFVFVSDSYTTRVIDVSHPTAPRMIGSVGFPAHDIAAVEGYLYFGLGHYGLRIFPRPCAP
jgi:hypothetical protein